MKPSFPLTRHEREDLIYSLDPLRYINTLGVKPFPWQQAYYQSTHRFKVINGARRAGKSFIISTKPTWRARFFPGSVTLILAYSEDQAEEDIRIIKKLIAWDKEYPELLRDNAGEIELKNGSRIIAVAATEKAARGYPDADIIIVDEAAFVEDMIFADCLYPMLNGNDRLEFNFISSPHGKRGNPGRFFAEAFEDKDNDRYEIRAPWDIDPTDQRRLIPAMPEADFQIMRAKEGINGFYSPRHANLEAQLKILGKGILSYRQNNLVEFVEPEDQVFSNDDIARLFDNPVKPLDVGVVGTAPRALVFDDME